MQCRTMARTNDYVDGKGFCCNDGSMEAAVAQARKAQSRAVAKSFKDPDNYENLQFFYHPDHLGSSSFITNLEGEVVQHIEYVPFGEVFIEERNNVWNTPYLFNAKEFDEETGMYYYGARYYEPRLSLWMSTDPLQEQYASITSYCYVGNSPLTYIDPEGKSPIKAIITAGKYVRKAYKIFKKTGKLTVKSLKQAGLDEIADMAGDLLTIFDGDASALDKIGAGVDLVVGTDFNNKGDKAAKKFLDIADDATSANKLSKKFDDITKGASFERKTKGNTNLYRKKGGMKSAEKDFNDMNLSDVTEFNTKYGTAKRCRNENGETVILRPGSSDGAPTIERQVNGRKKTEIRYDD